MIVNILRLKFENLQENHNRIHFEWNSIDSAYPECIKIAITLQNFWIDTEKSEIFQILQKNRPAIFSFSENSNFSDKLSTCLLFMLSENMGIMQIMIYCCIFEKLKATRKHLSNEIII